MNKNNLLMQYDKDLRMRIMYPEARREITGEVVRFIRQAPGRNMVSFTFANERQLHSVIHQEVDYFVPMNQPFTWKVYDHDPLPNLKAELRSHNFVEDPDPAAVMALEVESAPADLFRPVQVDIRRITTAAELKDIVHVLNSVYSNDNTWVYDRLGMHLKIPGYLSAYVAYVDAEPAAVAWTYFPHGQFATLFAGSTVAHYRNRGLYTGLLATRVQEIHARGYPFAIVETGPMSRPIVAKHGFQQLTTVYDYELNAN